MRNGFGIEILRSAQDDKSKFVARTFRSVLNVLKKSNENAGGKYCYAMNQFFALRNRIYPENIYFW
jgi:hypothetical protein